MQAAGRKPSGIEPIQRPIPTSTTERLAPLRYNASPPVFNQGLPFTMYSDPMAYFITWTCYGALLPGDERGWVKWHKSEQVPQPLLADWCRERMSEPVVVLNASQRHLVHQTVAEHCRIRHWKLHAVNCRTTHCHVVVTVLDYDGAPVRDQFKAWCTRKLKELERTPAGRTAKPREHWWRGREVFGICSMRNR